MRKLLPIILALIGLGGGIGAGLALRPPPEEPVVINPCGPPPVDGGDEEAQGHAPADAHDDVADAGEEAGEAEGEADPEAEPSEEYVKLNNQFIVPVVDKAEVQSLVVLSVSLEVKFGESEAVYRVEPKLRDSFLQVLFDHANAGGFDGAFTNANNMDVLRAALLEAAQAELGDVVKDLLIVDIVRQDSQ